MTFFFLCVHALLVVLVVQSLRYNFFFLLKFFSFRLKLFPLKNIRIYVCIRRMIDIFITPFSIFIFGEKVNQQFFFRLANRKIGTEESRDEDYRS